MNQDLGEDFLSGHRESDELVRLLGQIKVSFDAIEAPEPSAELLSFINNTSRGPESAASVDELLSARKRKRSLVALVATGTTVGKLMIGMSAAAASVAGIYATGLVDIPVLPERGQPSQIVATNSTKPTPSTAFPATTSPETGIPADDVYSFDAVDAGTVNIGATQGKLVSAIATTELGWKSQVNRTDAIVEIAFNTAGDEVGVRAVLDSGVLHVVISDDRTGTIEEFWIDKNNNRRLPEQSPQPQQQPGTTLAPTRASTNDKNSGEKSDDKKSDEKSDDDNDSDSDEKSDDAHDSDKKSVDARSDRYSSDDDESDEKESDDGKSDDGKSDRSGSGDDKSDDDKSDDDKSDDGAPRNDQSD